ncbi:MAG: queuosine precursor transporter [Methanobacterium sp.]
MNENEKNITRASQKNPGMAMVIVVTAYIGVQMISDISSLQIVSVFGLALDAGTFIYPFSFTLRDMAQKILGKENTRLLILCAAVINLFMALCFYIISLIPIDISAGGSELWTKVLTPVWRITLASIIAEVFSELLDTEVYSWWVEKVTKRHQWARVVISNAFSVPLDSLLFVFIAFYGKMPIEAVWQIFIGNVILKLIVTLVSIPMIYVVKDSDNPV